MYSLLSQLPAKPGEEEEVGEGFMPGDLTGVGQVFSSSTGGEPEAQGPQKVTQLANGSPGV